MSDLGSGLSDFGNVDYLSLADETPCAASTSRRSVRLVGRLGLAAVLPPLFVMVSSIGFVVPNATALALSRHPEAAGTGSALLGVIQSGIASFGAPIVGIAGITSALPMGSVIAIAGVGAVLAFVLTSRRPESPMPVAA